MSLLVRAAGQAGLVSVRQCDEDGLGKDRRYRLVASGRALAPTQGVVDLAPVMRANGMLRDAGSDHRRRRAACLALLAHGPAAIAVGQTALVLLGVQGLPPEIPPEVAMPAGSPRVRRAGVVVRNFGGPFPTVRRGAFQVVSPAWALAQAVCELDRDHAVAVLDSAVQRGLIRADEVGAVAVLARGRRGVARRHGWWELVDGRSQSPLETWARLRCRDAGVPPDALQVPIRDARGRIVARGDLGWRLRFGRWLVAEIDGVAPHSQPDAVYADRERQNEMLGTGSVDLVRFTARDVGSRDLVPGVVKARLAADAVHRRRAI